MMPTADELREYFHFDPDTGVLSWKKRPGPRVNMDKPEAGWLRSDGYVSVKFKKKNYTIHRLIWAHFYGVWPDHEVDHVNGRRDDNRIANLRPASRAQNARNRRASDGSVLKGVHLRSWGKWVAQIWAKDRKLHLGSFDTAEEAHAAYCAAAVKYHSEFARFE